MSDIDALKEKVRKLSSKATAKKMDLHDLSEDLPINWERIPEVAQETFETYRALTEARAELKKLEKA